MQAPHEFTYDWGVPPALLQPCVTFVKASRSNSRPQVFGKWCAWCNVCHSYATPEHLASNTHNIAYARIGRLGRVYARGGEIVSLDEDSEMEKSRMASEGAALWDQELVEIGCFTERLLAHQPATTMISAAVYAPM